MDIQIVSDLHLEFVGLKERYNIIKPVAPILILAGDICCCADDADFTIFKRFLTEVSEQFKLVFFVAGNHSFYYKPYPKLLNISNTMIGVMKKISDFFKTLKNTHFLNNSSYTIDNNGTKYTFIGSTLWSYIPDDKLQYIRNHMNDYNHIYIPVQSSIRKLQPTDVTAFFKSSKAYLTRAIAAAASKKNKIIVITHHRPYLTPHPVTQLDCAYMSDLSDIIEKYPISVWGYGHTHIRDNVMFKNTLMYSSPKGYPGQKTRFNNAEKIHVK